MEVRKMKTTLYTINVNKDNKDKAIKYCKEHNSLLAIEIRKTINQLATKYDKEMTIKGE